MSIKRSAQASSLFSLDALANVMRADKLRALANRYYKPSSAVRGALGNSSWMMIEKVIIMATNLLVTLILARSLGPESFGVLTYLLALLTIIGPIMSMGFNTIVTREIVNKPGDQSKIMSTTTLFRLVGGVLGNGLLLAWAWGFSDFAVGELKIFTLMALFNIAHAFQVVEFYFQAIVSIRLVSIMRSVVVIVFAMAKIALALLTDSLWLLALVFGIEFLILGLGYAVLYQLKGNGFNWRSVDFGYGFTLLRSAFWLILSGISSILYLKIDQVMLGNMAGFSDVGTYAVAVRISEVWYFVAEAISISFFAMLLKHRANSSSAYHRGLQKLCDGLFVLAFFLALSITLTATPLITILFGEDYRAAGTILAIHIWAGVFVFMRALASKWLVAENILVFSLVTHGIGAVVNIVANYFLIPRFGGIGAAWATVLSYAIASYFAFWLSARTRPIAWIMTSSMLLPFNGFKRYRGMLRKTL